MKKKVNMIWMASEPRSLPPFRILNDLASFELQSVLVLKILYRVADIARTFKFETLC